MLQRAVNGVNEPTENEQPAASARWWLAHQANDRHIDAFLEHLRGMSKADWRSINPRSKNTKVYAEATKEIEHLNSIYPERQARWLHVRSTALEIGRSSAPWGTYSPMQLGEAAADAVGALVQLYPWGHSFERLYGPFLEVIPLATLHSPAGRSTATEPRGAKMSSDAIKTRATRELLPSPAVHFQPTVDYGTALGFFGGEIFVVLIWLLVGAAVASESGPAGWLVGGLPAIASFFALKVSRGPIASMQIIQYEKRLGRLRTSDEATYSFVMRWRDRVTAIGTVVAVLELVLVIGYCTTHPG